MMNAETITADFVAAEDAESLQAVVLAAAIGGDQECQAQLPALQSIFDEPYRTVASVVSEKALGREFMDCNTLSVALGKHRLVRSNGVGQFEELTPSEVTNLLFATDIKPGQSAAYLQVMGDKLEERRRTELMERFLGAAKEFGDQPQRLLKEIEQLAAEAQKRGGHAADHPSEMLQLIPYMKRLEERQRGADFLGLDSGFDHFNNLCNGLDTGLFVLAATPGAGKTTWVWQVCCQAAEKNQFPVIFISMEQSADELRAKTLARMSKLGYRHILKGRLRSDDENWPKVLEAAKQYFAFSRNLTIVEGDQNTTVEAIEQLAAAKMAGADASRCLIAVDYLQILPLPTSDSGRVASAKDKVDLLVSGLRRVARKLDSPVIAVSSLNRVGYGKKDMEGFKETGGIEYSADLAGIMTEGADSTSKDADFRNVDLNIIKHRNGERGVLKYKFYPQCAEFIGTGKEDFIDDEASQ